jgi:hypothetical protein
MMPLIRSTMPQILFVAALVLHFGSTSHALDEVHPTEAFEISVVEEDLGAAVTALENQCLGMKNKHTMSKTGKAPRGMHVDIISASVGPVAMEDSDYKPTRAKVSGICRLK